MSGSQRFNFGAAARILADVLGGPRFGSQIARSFRTITGDGGLKPGMVLELKVKDAGAAVLDTKPLTIIRRLGGGKGSVKCGRTWKAM